MYTILCEFNWKMEEPCKRRKTDDEIFFFSKSKNRNNLSNREYLKVVLSSIYNDLSDRKNVSHFYFGRFPLFRH